MWLCSALCGLVQPTPYVDAVAAWLRDEGYLVLKDGARTGGDWFEGIDWSRTRAFCMGLTGVFLNSKGREQAGIVEEGEELHALKNEIAEKLNSGEGTVAQLVNDPAVYEALNDILVGVDESKFLRWLIRNRQKKGIEERYEDEVERMEDEGITPVKQFC